jgi:hypothetical protein
VNPLVKISRRMARFIPARFFSGSFFPRALFLGDSPQRFDMDRLFTASGSPFTDHRSLLRFFNSTGSGQSKTEKGYWSGIRKASKNSVAGYIPYIKNETKLLIYNFWSTNYGLRKQLLGHISLIHNGKFVSSHKITIPSSHIKLYDLNLLFGDQEGEAVFVDLFHPRLPNNHGGHDGHLRFWGIYGNHQATCHSMPFPMLNFHLDTVRSCRATFPITPAKLDLSTKLLHWSGKVSLPATDHFSEAAPFGFYVSTAESRVPTAVWHAAAYTGSPSKEPSDRCQLVALPPVTGVDVQLSFVEALKSRANVHFSLHGPDGHLLSKTVLPTLSNARIKASEIFPEASLTGNQLLVIFLDAPEVIHHGYLHLFYFVNDNPSDCVHSHKLDAQENFLPLFNTGIKVVPDRKGQALKFMHFPTQDGFQSWLAIWTYDDALPIKLRLIDEEGNEFVKNSQVPATGIHYINLNALIDDFGAKRGPHYIVQLQSDFSNFNANLFTESEISTSISVDHLTGG